jgi:hypothetical protein
VDTTCYQTGVIYGIERFTGDVYGVDVLSGTSWLEFTIPNPPGANSASPNGLAYDEVTGYFYYTDYQLGTTPGTLYFWDGVSQQVAGQVTGTVACADMYEGKYYYISTTDDLWKVTFNPDGTILSNDKLDDIAGNARRWTFDGDIAVKDGVVYGWGRCALSGHGFEFFTYDLTNGAFSYTKSAYQQSLQLAFGSNGELYGHRSGTGGYFYVVDTTNGAVTLVTPTPDPQLQYTDTASGMICEPYDETAWAGECPFPGKNWATYFEYEVTWTLLETVIVPATKGTPTDSTTVLESGKDYLIEVSGTYFFRAEGNPNGWLADAEYAYRKDYLGYSSDDLVWHKGDGGPYSEPYNGLDLCIDINVNTDWGEFNEDHVYSILYPGEGVALSFVIKDNVYSDNAGSLTVKIYG